MPLPGHGTKTCAKSVLTPTVIIMACFYFITYDKSYTFVRLGNISRFCLKTKQKLPTQVYRVDRVRIRLNLYPTQFNKILSIQLKGGRVRSQFGPQINSMKKNISHITANSIKKLINKNWVLKLNDAKLCHSKY